ncbi:glycosyltransferase family 2 protein [Avrilella dinanensis]|uniref:glycosyltransferase family 2 protein n=1 Tax=Avrilella dinanensis TaxID=2008672 RepID=UPI0024096E05|nr:glycosyltransferase [Avrilella dinanensis]
MQTLSIITPVFNEESTLAVFFEHLVNFQKKVKNYQIEWVIVDDGSRDATPEIIQKLTEENVGDFRLMTRQVVDEITKLEDGIHKFYTKPLNNYPNGQA